MNEHAVEKAALFSAFPPPDGETARKFLLQARQGFSKTLIVLDDDPTGIQTVHDVSVYTDWSVDSIKQGLENGEGIFFLLTNSRSFSPEKTRQVHREIAQNALAAGKAAGKEFVLMLRGDSTLRGHFPLETETLRQTLEEETGLSVDGEIIMPFFAEGGRFTAGDVHYVQDGETLHPAGQTEFAKDKSFAYASSNLKEWVEEKTGGAFPASQVLSVSLEQLRGKHVENIVSLLMGMKNFQKMIVNALDTADAEVFAAACLEAMKQGKRFLFRSAAALPKALGAISDQPLLTGSLLRENSSLGGLVIAGSHVGKTSLQLKELARLSDVDFVEFNPLWGIIPGGLEEESQRVLRLVGDSMKKGRTAVIQTPRQRLEIGSGRPEDELRLAVAISDALTSLVRRLPFRPAFLIAKGGITSSDVGTKGLGVRHARVAGQLLPGVPVWKCGEESLFPGLPYIIFPGNVGAPDSLREAVERLKA